MSVISEKRTIGINGIFRGLAENDGLPYKDTESMSGEGSCSIIYEDLLAQC
jgi:hypothetical protein